MGSKKCSAYNGHFESVCDHPRFLFNDRGDCAAAKLRSGHVHSANDWDELLVPEVEPGTHRVNAWPSGPTRPLRSPRSTRSWRHAVSSTRSGCRRTRAWNSKAAACLVTDREVLLTFFAFPAEHWIHLRTTNLIESPYATVRLRQRVTKRVGFRTKGLLMAYKLLDMAQRRWRRLNAAHLLPFVRAGVVFIDGVQKERNTEETTPTIDSDRALKPLRTRLVPGISSSP